MCVRVCVRVCVCVGSPRSVVVVVDVVVDCGELLTEAKIIKPFWMLSECNAISECVGTCHAPHGICNANFLHLLFTLPLPPHLSLPLPLPFPLSLRVFWGNVWYAQFVDTSSHWPRVATVIGQAWAVSEKEREGDREGNRQRQLVTKCGKRHSSQLYVCYVYVEFYLQINWGFLRFFIFFCSFCLGFFLIEVATR